jgi:anti-anti-sigma regulatory factor
MKTILLAGDVGIKKSRILYDIARTVLEAGPVCAIDFSKVKRLDCSVVQVVLALRRECERKGGICKIKNVNEVTARLLECAGIKQGA